MFCASRARLPPTNNADLSTGRAVKRLGPRKQQVGVPDTFEYALQVVFFNCAKITPGLRVNFFAPPPVAEQHWARAHGRFSTVGRLLRASVHAQARKQSIIYPALTNRCSLNNATGQWLSSLAGSWVKLTLVSWSALAPLISCLFVMKGLVYWFQFAAPLHVSTFLT